MKENKFQYAFDHAANILRSEPKIAQIARSNRLDNFTLHFAPTVLDGVIDGLEVHDSEWDSDDKTTEWFNQFVKDAKTPWYEERIKEVCRIVYEEYQREHTDEDS